MSSMVGQEKTAVRRRRIGVSVDRNYGQKWPVFRVNELEDADPDGPEVQELVQVFQAALDNHDQKVAGPPVRAQERVHADDRLEMTRRRDARPALVVEEWEYDICRGLGWEFAGAFHWSHPDFGRVWFTAQQMRAIAVTQMVSQGP